MKAVIDLDGKKAIVNTETDETILEVGGTDLMAHVSMNRRTVFYLYHWSRMQGERNRIKALTKKQALDWLTKNFYFADMSDLEAAEKYGLEVHEAPLE
jgi:hypothetical protein